eukprot:9237562-Ditylum_brightwellii.AAC.1
MPRTSPCKVSGAFDTTAAHAIPVPKSESEWASIPQVDEGFASWKSTGPIANFIQGQVEQHIIPFDVTPERVRALYHTFLQKYKKSSFQNWYYNCLLYTSDAADELD